MPRREAERRRPNTLTVLTERLVEQFEQCSGVTVEYPDANKLLVSWFRGDARIKAELWVHDTQMLCRPCGGSGEVAKQGGFIPCACCDGWGVPKQYGDGNVLRKGDTIRYRSEDKPLTVRGFYFDPGFGHWAVVWSRAEQDPNTGELRAWEGAWPAVECLLVAREDNGKEK